MLIDGHTGKRCQPESLKPHWDIYRTLKSSTPDFNEARKLVQSQVNISLKRHDKVIDSSVLVLDALQDADATFRSRLNLPPLSFSDHDIAPLFGMVLWCVLDEDVEHTWRVWPTDNNKFYELVMSCPDTARASAITST